MMKKQWDSKFQYKEKKWMVGQMVIIDLRRVLFFSATISHTDYQVQI
jgi:hypothetical protein